MIKKRTTPARYSLFLFFDPYNGKDDKFYKIALVF